jgi:hypothetical protein
MEQDKAVEDAAKEHELKTLCKYFQEVKSGKKTFELRNNDRDYNIGDVLWLKEYNPLTGYTGDELKVKVEYILTDAVDFGLLSGFCLMSIKPLQQQSNGAVLSKIIEWTQRLGEMGWYMTEKGQWEHDNETGCFENTEALVKHYNSDFDESQQNTISDEDGWIELEKEPPPPIGEPVLVYMSYGKIDTCYWTGELWLQSVRSQHSNGSVTHWRPLPQPPKSALQKKH